MKLLKKIASWFWKSKTLDDGRRRVRFLFFRKTWLPEISVLKQQLLSCERALAVCQQKLDNYEKSLIASSPLWDPLWYVREYGYEFNRYEALAHWYEKGWKLGERPSPNMMYSNETGEPSILTHNRAYLPGSLFYTRKGNLAPLPEDVRRIKEYLHYKKTRKAKGVIYSCITNGYDSIREKLIYRYLDPDWDYVLFSDDASLLKEGVVGIWEVRPLQFTALDNTRNSRWHKTHPHILFPDYEESIFIDGNINILSDFLFRTIRTMKTPIVLPRHFKNLCIYQEFSDVADARLDDADVISAEKDFIEAEGMPKMYGMGETNILYRRHSELKVAKICDDWWSMIEKYSKRDQLAFTYVLWKYDIKVEDVTFECARMLRTHFFLFEHAGARVLH